MLRFVTVVCGSFLIVQLALGAPGPKLADGPPAYFPSAVGATAVYQSTAGKLSMEMTDKVTDVVKTSDGVRVTIERTSSSSSKAVTIETDVSAKGLAEGRFGSRENDPPIPRLRLPFKAGDSWDWEPRKADDVRQRKFKFKLVGEEEVEVPAGKFKAVRVAEEEESRGRTTRHDAWYAPKVGLIKRTTQLLVGEQVIVLKSFTPGKE
jgi:hypothetical protein